jgi:tetratricopeptide (TPR) repeat protein
MVQGDSARSVALHEELLVLSRELHLERHHSSSLNALGTIYARQGNYEQALVYLEEALVVARRSGHPEVLTAAFYMLAGVLLDAGHAPDRSIALYEECLALARQHGMGVTESMTLASLGILYTMTGNLAPAAELLPKALQMQRELNATMAIGWTLQFLGILAYAQGDDSSAGRYLLESLEAAPQGGAQLILPLSLEGIAGVAAMRHRPEPAARLLGAVEALRETMNLRRPPIEQPLYERILTAVRSQLPEDVLSAAWQAGRTLTPAQAIAEAEGAVRGR